MSEQLALDLEVAEPVVRPTRVEIAAGRPPFTALQFAVVAQTEARRGPLVPQRVGAGGWWSGRAAVWTLTPWGRSVALDLALCGGSEKE